MSRDQITSGSSVDETVSLCILGRMGNHSHAALLLILLAPIAGLGGCEPAGLKQADGLSDAAIIDAIAARPNMKPEPASYAIAPLSFRREMRFVVRNQASGESIACGYARLPPAGRIQVEHPVVFVAKGATVYLASDLPADEFSKLQADLCGPAWVEPLVQSPIVITHVVKNAR